MRTLNISLSEQDYKKYGINSENIRFNKFIDLIKNVIAREALEKCHQIAKQSGLNNISTDEINAEINSIRGAKGNN